MLVIIEGLYSTEGDVPDLAGVIDIKSRYGAWLMVDDAHGCGVLGATGGAESARDAREIIFCIWWRRQSGAGLLLREPRRRFVFARAIAYLPRAACTPA